MMPIQMAKISQETGNSKKTENVPTRLSCHPLHVVLDQVEGSSPVWVQQAKHGEHPEVVSIHLVPASAELGGAPGGEVLLRMLQHGFAGGTDPLRHVPVSPSRGVLHLLHLPPTEVQHGVPVIVTSHKRDPATGVRVCRRQQWPQQTYEEGSGGPAGVGPHRLIREGSAASSKELS